MIILSESVAWSNRTPAASYYVSCQHCTLVRSDPDSIMEHSLIAILCIVMIKLDSCSSFLTHQSPIIQANLRAPSSMFVKPTNLLSTNLSSAKYDISSSNDDDNLDATQQQKTLGRRNFVSFALANSVAAIANAESTDENSDTKNGDDVGGGAKLLRNLVGGVTVAIIIKDVTSQSYSLTSVDGIDKRDCALCKEEEEKKSN